MQEADKQIITRAWWTELHLSIMMRRVQSEYVGDREEIEIIDV